MKLKVFLTVIFVFLIFQFSFSQNKYVPSYIIKNNEDTIFGTGNMNKKYNYCLFKSLKSEEFSKFYPTNIKAFRIIDGKYYITKEIAEENGKLNWHFLEFLVNGKVNLYQLPITDRYFIEKEDNNITEINSNIKNIKRVDEKEYFVRDKKYIGLLKVYMSDAPEIFPEIEKLNRLEQRNLINLSMDYHNTVCSEYECINYAKKIPAITYKLEVLSGMNYHNSYYTPQYGVLLHIWRPLHNEKLYLKVGVLYSDRPFWKKGWPENEEEKEKRSYSIKIPISLQYVFGKKDFKPTFAIGFPTGLYPLISAQGGFIYSISNKLELSFSGSIDGLLLLLLNQQHEAFDNNFGHTLNFGIIYRIK